MATTTTPFKTDANWKAENRYTASGETDIILSNTASKFVTWCLTTDDTEPTIEATDGHPLEPMSSRAMTLNDGERIWFAGYRARVSLGV